ncbi:MAG: cysteine methyltransferase [Roseateles depolymerans]|uniref:Methylated-DNA--protein-cysteine methyltransferase n=1 Tax=Roseateles depolymerans TaxID=76731 RepID=A0A2W5DKZ3_9BURK|nr:MAG: cysteine methyltransferase [Roseateles depolymerans]
MTPHHLLQTRLPTPLGPLTAARSARGLSGLWFDGQKHHPGPLAVPVDGGGDAVFATTARALADYFAGRAPHLPPLDPLGTPFQQAVWAELLQLPSGASASYGHLAARLGRAGAARALGAAVGRNPISILIPCHRVVGADGALTGYAGGLARKQALLALESGGNAAA